MMIPIAYSCITFYYCLYMNEDEDNIIKTGLKDSITTTMTRNSFFSNKGNERDVVFSRVSVYISVLYL